MRRAKAYSSSCSVV